MAAQRTPEQVKQLKALADRIAALTVDIDTRTKALKYTDPADVACTVSRLVTVF